MGLAIDVPEYTVYGRLLRRHDVDARRAPLEAPVLDPAPRRDARHMRAVTDIVVRRVAAGLDVLEADDAIAQVLVRGDPGVDERDADAAAGEPLAPHLLDAECAARTVHPGGRWGLRPRALRHVDAGIGVHRHPLAEGRHVTQTRRRLGSRLNGERVDER